MYAVLLYFYVYFNNFIIFTYYELYQGDTRKYMEAGKQGKPLRLQSRGHKDVEFYPFAKRQKT